MSFDLDFDQVFKNPFHNRAGWCRSNNRAVIIGYPSYNHATYCSCEYQYGIIECNNIPIFLNPACLVFPSDH